jgi:hypothetical protein
MRKIMHLHATILHRCVAYFLTVACLALPMAAHAKNAPPLTAIAQLQGECARPTFKIGEVADHGASGYGIEVQGERYWVALNERLTFPLLAHDGGDVIAQLKLERAPSNNFGEQSAWRERWLQDVAARAGVSLKRQALQGGAFLLTLNKKALTGKFAGLSLLVDSERQLFAQWDWSNLPSYAGPQDMVTMQTAVWERLIPCFLK